MQQAKAYAETLGLLFAYATNGLSILEFDFSTGLERDVAAFPSPAELWTRYRAAKGLSELKLAQFGRHSIVRRQPMFG